MKKTILDASSAILLFKTHLLKKLTGLYHVSVTGSVLQELTIENRRGSGEFHQYVSMNRIEVLDFEETALETRTAAEGLSQLGSGELDTIKCFDMGKHDFIITDDGRAARYCMRNGLPFINALLFPRLLYFADYVIEKDCLEKMKEIINLGRYSQGVIDWAHSCARESLIFALPEERPGNDHFVRCPNDGTH